MKKKLLTTLCALTAASTVAAAPVSAQAASLSTALQSKGACVNKVVVTNQAASLEEVRQFLSDLGANCNLSYLEKCIITNLPNCSLPSNPEDDTTQTPEIETPSQPETETPEQPEVETPEQPETETPEQPEVETPEQPETETPEQPEVNVPSQPEAETPHQPEVEVPSTPETETPSQPENTPSEETNTNSAYINRIVELVNEERAKEGLSPVTLDTKVTAAAQVRAKEIVTSFSHTRPNGTSFSTALKEQNVSYRGSGENIAWGQKSPEAVMNAWMNSSGHRANILNKNFTTIGVGYYQTANGTNHWAQLFTY